MNDIFVDLTNHFETLAIIDPPSYVTKHLLVSQYEVYHALSSINIGKAVGPDRIPNKMLRDFAFQLAPDITAKILHH